MLHHGDAGALDYRKITISVLGAQASSPARVETNQLHLIN
jgi:hypothetical protein